MPYAKKTSILTNQVSAFLSKWLIHEEVVCSIFKMFVLVRSLNFHVKWNAVLAHDTWRACSRHLAAHFVVSKSTLSIVAMYIFHSSIWKRHLHRIHANGFYAEWKKFCFLRKELRCPENAIYIKYMWIVKYSVKEFFKFLETSFLFFFSPLDILRYRKHISSH